MHTPEICNCNALRESARRVTRLYDDVLAPTGLGANQYTALAKINVYGPVSVQALAEQLIMDRSTLTRLLGPIERRGLITVRTSEEDRRSKLIELTSGGRALLKKATPLWNAAQERFEKAFGSQPSRKLRASLKEIATADFNAA